MPAADVAGRNAAVVVAPARLVQLGGSFFSGSSRVTESRVRTEEFLRPGLVGL